jgi:hypothetical protein
MLHHVGRQMKNLQPCATYDAADLELPAPFIEISERQKLDNDHYYENFVTVAKWCERREAKEKAWTRRKRGAPVESSQ